MGRPRSKNRMSRMVQARVTDEQWNYLEYRAVEFHDGDLSAAIREAVVFAREFTGILEASSPADALSDLQDRWRREAENRRNETFMDEADDED
jgi:hypothetical protein